MTDPEKKVISYTDETDEAWDEETLNDWREKMSEPVGYEIIDDSSEKERKGIA